MKSFEAQVDSPSGKKSEIVYKRSKTRKAADSKMLQGGTKKIRKAAADDGEKGKSDKRILRSSPARSKAVTTGRNGADEHKRDKQIEEEQDKDEEQGEEEDKEEEGKQDEVDSDYAAENDEESPHGNNSQIVLHDSQTASPRVAANPMRPKASRKKLVLVDEEYQSPYDFQSQQSVSVVKKAFEHLEKVPAWLESVNAAGFGAFRTTDISTTMNKNCMGFCMKNLNTHTMTMEFGNNKEIEVNRYNIHLLTGLPNGDQTAPRPTRKRAQVKEEVVKLKSELQITMGNKGEITIKSLLEKLGTLVDDELKAHEPGRQNTALKVFYLIFFNKILCPGSSTCLMRELGMIEGLQFDKMIQMDYCQIVVDEIQRAAEEWQNNTERTQWTYLEGFTLGPMLMYLDSLICDNLAEMTTRSPRISYLKTANLERTAQLDCRKDEDGIQFGNIKVSVPSPTSLSDCS